MDGRQKLVVGLSPRTEGASFDPFQIFILSMQHVHFLSSVCATDASLSFDVAPLLLLCRHVDVKSCLVFFNIYIYISATVVRREGMKQGGR